MQQKLLKELIDLYFSYAEDREEKELNLSSFIGFLNARNQPEQRGEDGRMSTGFNTEMTDPGIYVVYLYRYAKEYVKKALKGSVLNSADEFSFLITLLSGGSHTKSELIQKMILTKTSGTEVLKRLAKKGLIEETTDPDDKRSVRVSISEEGKRVTFALLPAMDKVSKVIVGNLSSEELTTLNFLLRKLELHHRAIYDDYPKASLDELLNQSK